ncbi:hypothetical protein ACT8ZR_18245 [Neobacillus sp. M.A.Huq-85]
MVKNQSTMEMDFYKPEQDIYDYFNRNKESYIDTVVDVIIDRCNKPTYMIIKALSEKMEPRIKDNAQDKFVIDVIKVFNQYISDIQKVIHNANGYLVENGLDNRNKVFYKVS